jgi:hypothetical protein
LALARFPHVVGLPFDLYRHEEVMSPAATSEEVLVVIVEQVWLPLVGQHGGIQVAEMTLDDGSAHHLFCDMPNITRTMSWNRSSEV